MTRARRALVLSWPEAGRGGPGDAVTRSTRRRATRERRRGGDPRGGAVRTRRGASLDLPDASRRGARGVVAGRLGALGDAPRHRRGREPGGRALPRAGQARGAGPAPRRASRRASRSTALNELLGRVASPEQRAAISSRRRSTSTCSARSATAPPAASWSRRGASRRSSSSCPAAASGLGAVGVRHRPLPHLPAEVQVRARLRDPAGADDQPALRDPDPPGARALPRRGAARAGGREPRPSPASLDRLLALFEAGWRRTGLRRLRRRAPVPRSRRRGAGPLPGAPPRTRTRSPVWLERSFAFPIGPHQLRGRVDRVDRLPDGGYELIDYKTGDPGRVRSTADDVQIALYRIAAREAWQVEAELRQLLVRARRSNGSACRRPPTTPSGSSAPCSRSPPGSRARTSSRAPRTRSARGATTG